MLEPGSTLGERYRVGRVIGKGGMGVVIEATHLQLGTQVAVKILKKESAQPTHIERFLREARAAAQLKGEHICRVHDFGTLPDGAPYMVMELLAGQDLSSMLKRGGPVESGLVARYMLQVCTAMAEAHALGIVHRDLKPGNLFVVERPDGTPMIKVLDFGIAKSAGEVDFSLTDTTNVMGSPAYMSPEQLKSSKNVDARSDIWSLGIVMYELLTGQHPFKGESLTELAINIANDPPPPLPASVPDELAALVMTCIEKLPRKRFGDVADLAAALEPHATVQANVAGAVARVLTKSTGPVPSLDGEMTSPGLPSQLARGGTRSSVPVRPVPQSAIGTALLDEAHVPAKVTTLGIASGVVAAQTGQRPTRPSRTPLLAGAALMLAIVGGVAFQLTRGSSEPVEPATAPTPATAPATAAPTPAPPPTPAPASAAPAIADPVVAAPEPTEEPQRDSGSGSGTAPTTSTSTSTSTPTKPRKGKHRPGTGKGGKATAPDSDLTKSRY